MDIRCVASTVILVALAAVAPRAQTYEPPRTPDGQPDMQGYWSTGGSAGMATYNVEGGENEVHLELSRGCAQGIECSSEQISRAAARKPDASIIVDPPDGKVPFQPWAAAKKRDIVENHTNPLPQHLDPMARCYPAGVPRATYQEYEAFQIIQTPGYVVMVYEFLHSYRIIPLTSDARLPEGIKLWMGDSRGRWEGNTLVVDVTNHNDKTWFDIVGTFHSDALRIVERWTLAAADTIRYEATIEDRKVFTRPWKIAFTLSRNKEPGFELVEVACVEGERSVEQMLRK